MPPNPASSHEKETREDPPPYTPIDTGAGLFPRPAPLPLLTAHSYATNNHSSTSHADKHRTGSQEKSSIDEYIESWKIMDACEIERQKGNQRFFHEVVAIQAKLCADKGKSDLEIMEVIQKAYEEDQKKRRRNARRIATSDSRRHVG